jgi:hypothetical protein
MWETRRLATLYKQRREEKRREEKRREEKRQVGAGDSDKTLHLK